MRRRISARLIPAWGPRSTVNAMLTAREVAFARAPVNVQHSRAMTLSTASPRTSAASPALPRPAWLDRACVIVPALDAERTLLDVIASVRAAIPECSRAILVLDDGSRDRTAEVARELGCVVVSHPVNLGKGRALRTAFAAALERGWDVAVTVDADGQHPGDEVRAVLFADAPEDALVLGVRDLSRAGAPRRNRFSNEISNHFLSRFAGRSLRDTQCGLRRYPIRRSLGLGARGDGYDFEAEVLLRAVWAGLALLEVPIEVLYPEDRTTHFRVSRDVWRIIRTVVLALGDRALGRAP
jgi:glycosyltransferase involved in cell wall biosynthesis